MKKWLILVLLVVLTDMLPAYSGEPVTAFEKGSRPSLHYSRGRTDNHICITWSTFRDHAQADYLFQNHSFEEGDISQWGGINGSIERTTEEKLLGDYSLKFMATDDSAFTYFQISPSTNVINLWDVRLRLKSSEGTAILVGVCTSPDWDDGKIHSKTGGSEFVWHEQIADGTWQSFECEFYNNQDGTSNFYDDLYVLIGSTTDMNGEIVYIDSVEVVESHGTPVYSNTVVKYWKEEEPSIVYTDSTNNEVVFHRVDLEGLDADTKYFYNVRSDEAESTFYQSETFHFTTQPPCHEFTKPFTILVTGDERASGYKYMCRERWYRSGWDLNTNEKSNKYWKTVCDSIIARHPGEIDHATSIGDIVSHACPYRYRKQYRCIDSLTKYTTWNISMGNHEDAAYNPCYNGYNAVLGDKYRLFKDFNPIVQDNNAAVMGYTTWGEWDSLSYFYDIQNVRIVHRSYKTIGSDKCAPYESWYDNVVYGNLPDGIDWIIELNHIAIYNSQNNPIRLFYTDRAKFYDDKISIMIAGHYHQYEMFEINNAPYIVQGNSGESSSSIPAFEWNSGNMHSFEERIMGYSLLKVYEDQIVIEQWGVTTVYGDDTAGLLKTFEIKNKIGNHGMSVSPIIR